MCPPCPGWRLPGPVPTTNLFGGLGAPLERLRKPPGGGILPLHHLEKTNINPLLGAFYAPLFVVLAAAGRFPPPLRERLAQRCIVDHIGFPSTSLNDTLGILRLGLSRELSGLLLQMLPTCILFLGMDPFHRLLCLRLTPIWYSVR